MPLETRARSASTESRASDTLGAPTGPQVTAQTSDAPKSPFKGGTYSMIQEQLRELENFSGDPAKISWDTFEYRFLSALDVATNLPEKLKLSLLKQKLTGAPAELLRLNQDLREQTFEELLSWLSLRYQEIHTPQAEQRKWQSGDTPDSYLVRIQRSAENDLPPLPVRKIYRRDQDDELVRDDDGNPVMDDNPDYTEGIKKRQEYIKTIDTRLRHDYIDGLKPSIQRKLIDPPATLEKVHELVRRIYIHELRHPETMGEAMVAKPSTGLAVFASQPAGKSEETKGKPKEMDNAKDMHKAFHGMKDVTQTLAKAMVRMTEQGAVKPTAKAGTARDPAEPQRLCYECDSPDHLARDCEIRIAKNAASRDGSKGRGAANGKSQRGRGGGSSNFRGNNKAYNPAGPPGQFDPQNMGYPAFGYPNANVGYMYPMFPNTQAIGAFQTTPTGNGPNKPKGPKNSGKGFGGKGKGKNQGATEKNKTDKTETPGNKTGKYKPGGQMSNRKQEIMANVAHVLDQLHGEWVDSDSKNE